MHDLFTYTLFIRVAIIIRFDDSFEALWVDLRFNRGFVVPNEVIVKLNASWLLLLNDEFPDLKEELIDFRVLLVPLGGDFRRTR